MRPAIVACVAVAVALLAAGCEIQDKPATVVATHTLAPTEYSYVGYLVPSDSRKLTVAASDLSVKPGTAVTAGMPLLAVTPERSARIKLLSAETANYSTRIKRLESAIEAIHRGGSGVYSPDGTAPSADVRSAELAVVAAVAAEERSGLEYRSELSKLPATGSDQERAFLTKSRQLAQREYRIRMEGLLQAVASACAHAREAAQEELVALDARAPIGGVVAVRADAVWIDSATASFIYIATEDQAEVLRGQSQLSLSVRGKKVGTLTLASSTFDADATTNSSSPRYRLTFDVAVTGDFVARDHGTATISFQGGALSVPPAFLGHDDRGDFVMVGGVRHAVSASKDALGQLVVTASDLRAGDVIQQVGK